MRVRRVEELSDCLDRLHEETEVHVLSDELLVTMTRFFSDLALFETLEREVVPHLFDERVNDGEVRAWSVGCATGEEAYSLAILLLEESHRHERAPRVRVFATELHERSLRIAMKGVYAGDIAADVSPDRLRRFFREEAGSYRVRQPVREAIVFARHDLLADPPYSGLDLIICRNLLTYFEPRVQRAVLELFHRALRRGGILAMAGVETRDDWGPLFVPLDTEPPLLRRGDIPTPDSGFPSLDLEVRRHPVQAAHGGAAAAQSAVDARLRSLEAQLAHARQRLLALTGEHEALRSMNEELRALAEENHHKAEELEALATDLERLLLSTGIGVVFLDPELRIVRYTPRIAHLFHAHPSDRGRPLAELKHTLDYRELLDDVRTVLRDADPAEREVHDNEDRAYLARIIPHWGAGGELDGAVLVFVDITTRKRREEAQEESRIKGQFLSIMSHELRTPLNAVIGLSDLMQTDVLGPTTERQQNTLARIKQSAWHLVRIIEEVLTYSRSEAGKEQSEEQDVDIAEVARQVVDMIRPMADSRAVDVALTGADEAIWARTDGGKVAQIATNLVGNAVEFAKREIVVTLESDSCWVVMRIRDDGPGIPSEKLNEIFEPFTQVDGSITREKGGTGLGLTIAQRQAWLLHGDVLVESAVGKGSTFTLRLPREPSQAGEGERMTGQDAEQRSTRRAAVHEHVAHAPSDHVIE